MQTDMTAQPEKVPGWWVREARLAKQRSQRALEEMTGRDRTTVYRWEKERAEVEWMTWCGILHLLGHPIGWEPAGRTPRGRGGVVEGDGEDDGDPPPTK